MGRGRFTPGTAIGLIFVVAGLGVLAVALTRGRVGAPSYRPPAPPAPPTAETVEPIVAARLAELTAAVQTEPTSAAAWARLGGAYLVHDQRDSAVTCLDVAQRLDEADFRWPYLLGLATETGDRVAAIDHWRRATALQTAYPPAHIHLGNALRDAGALDEARAQFGAALAAAPASVAAHLGLAEVALAVGDLDAARVHLEEARRFGPRSGRIHTLVAETHRRAGNLAAAEDHLKAAAHRRPDEPIADPVREAWVWDEGVGFRWRLTRSVSYERAGQTERALDAWRELLAFDPESADAHTQMGHVLARAGRHEEASASYRAALDIEANPETTARLGVLVAERTSPEAGLAMIDAALADRPGDPAIRRLRAGALRDLGRVDEALPILWTLADADPDEPRLAMELGVTLRRAGRASDAAAVFRRVLDLDPTWPGAQSHLAHAIWDGGDHAAAIAEQSGLYAKAPDDPQVQSDLAWMLATSRVTETRRGAEARALVEPLCEKTDYANPILLRTLAAACAETGDFPAAVQHAQRALSLIDDRSPAAWRDLVGDLQEQLAAYAAGRPFRD